MTTSFTSLSSDSSLESASWCFLLLEHLDEFATLAWYLVADGKLVEDTFARTMTELDLIAFDASIPTVAYSQARDVLITEAIAVLSDVRSEEDPDQFFQPSSIVSLPDLPRLAFMLRVIIRSSKTEVAKFLGLSPSEVQGLVTCAIDRLNMVPPISALTGCHDA